MDTPTRSPSLAAFLDATVLVGNYLEWDEPARAEALVEAAWAPLGPDEQVEVVLRLIRCPRPTANERAVARSVLHRVDPLILLPTIIQDVDSLVLDYLPLSSAQAQQVTEVIVTQMGTKLTQSPLLPLLEILTRKAPEFTLAIALAPYWSQRTKKVPDELKTNLSRWLLQAPHAEANLLNRVITLAKERYRLHAKGGLGTLGLRDGLAEYLDAQAVHNAWKTAFPGEVLAEQVGIELERLPPPSTPRRWSKSVQQWAQSLAHHPDHKQIAQEAGWALEHWLWAVSSQVQLNQHFHGETTTRGIPHQVAQAIVAILDRENIHEPWRQVWSDSNSLPKASPLRQALVPSDRLRQLHAQPAATIHRPRPRS